jgi:hypothetical protein
MVDVKPNQLAYFYLVEIEKTRLYLISQRLISGETQLQMVLPALDNSQHEIAKSISQDQDLEYKTVDILAYAKNINLAEQTGYSVFELDTPENRFSKRDVINTFNPITKTDTTPQVQATHFFLHGEVGREIAKTWFEAGLQGIHMFDHTPSLQGDPEDFVLHKSDQSLLSLSLKSLSAAERMVPPPAGNRGLLSRLSAMRAPIWVSRNRNGKSLKGPLLKLLELLTK